MSDPSYTLIIKLIRGKFLTSYNALEKLDSFVRITIGQKVLKSPTIQSSQDPEWNKLFTFQLNQTQYDDLENLTLLFEAFDEDIIADELLGKVSVKLSQIKLKAGEINSLTLVNNKNAVIGTIDVVAELKQGDQANLDAPPTIIPQKKDVMLTSYTLIIKALRGKLIKDPSGSNKMDTYACITVGTNTQKSQVIRQSKTPEWKKTYTFPLTQTQYNDLENLTLLFQVFDHQIFFDDLLGKVSVKLSQLKLKEGEINSLTLVDNKDVDAGTIDVEVVLQTNNPTGSLPLDGGRREETSVQVKERIVIGTIIVNSVSGKFEAESNIEENQNLRVVFAHGDLKRALGFIKTEGKGFSFKEITELQHLENEKMSVKVLDNHRDEIFGEGHIDIPQLHKCGLVRGDIVIRLTKAGKTIGELSINLEFTVNILTDVRRDDTTWSPYDLTIKLIRGKFLKNSESVFNSLDAYVRVTFEKKTQKSDVVKGQGQTSEWKQVLTFPLTQAQYNNLENLNLVFEAFDHHFFADELLGKVSVKLSQMKLKAGEIDSLSLVDNKNADAGTIDVEVELKKREDQPNPNVPPAATPQKKYTKTTPSILFIKPLGGKFFKNYAESTKMDPFVRVTIEKDVQKSHVARGMANTSEWKRTLAFPLTQAQYKDLENLPLLFEVFHEDFEHDEFIGNVSVTVSQVKLKAGEINQLTLVDNKNADIGMIDIEIELK